MGNSASTEEETSEEKNARRPDYRDHDDAAEEDLQDEAQQSYWEMCKQGYQELVNAIIRPPRADYEEAHLGPSKFYFGNQEFQRDDMELRNDRDMRIKCSHWKASSRRNKKQGPKPCVIYMHGNSSARLEAIPQLSLCLALGVTLFAFDFTGSGLSDGEYVSLGFFEREDLKAVVHYLRESGNVSTIALWGRSMGAATSLLHGDRDPSIAAMVLDSPFSDLTQLAEEMVDKGRDQGLTVPGFVVSIAIRMIKSSVQKQAGFDIKDLSPIAHADRCFIPALFVAGEGDDFIKPDHSRNIHAKYAGDKNLVIVEGDHNSQRPRFLFDSVAIFLQTYLQLPPDSGLTNVDPYNNGLAPWHGNHQDTGSPFSEFGAQDLGMTSERQRETQRALYNMLSAGTHNDGGDESSETAPSKKWVCDVCTLENNGLDPVCEACGSMDSTQR